MTGKVIGTAHRGVFLTSRVTETGFSSEVRQIWGDLPINTIDEVAKALLVACADETLHGKKACPFIRVAGIRSD